MQIMTIGSIDGNGMQAVRPAAKQSGDALSKSLEKQIAEKKSQMQELSANQELSVEEKMQKRQELQQQIFELQNQLRQHEIELRKEAQESQGTQMEDMLGGKRETEEAGSDATVVSQEGMEAMISADSALSQAKVQGSAGRKLKGEAKTLRTEAKLDSGRGRGADDKLSAAAALEQRAAQAGVSQAKGLKEASEKLSDAAESDREKSEETVSGEAGDIRVQYGNSVVMEISGEAMAALAESQKEEE